ncbi:MAG: aminotransferase class III-fold pyridoxal phosphate-dependent enzyme [Leptospiraceae bacterium]|nr:aminotransferase class III-fold pyridoxal phosphate-dependent enzyme [Leptospiraceae bacterium]MDW8306043.1 aminotransferase class III-fold pyridoxal phosphate-dependent enzyme [Leptospiraceae bacterium]
MSHSARNINSFLRLVEDSYVPALSWKKHFDGQPLLVKKGKGAYLWDEEKKVYVDFYLSGGRQLFGHGDKELNQCLKRELKRGNLRSYLNRLERDVALEILRYFPQGERLLIFSSRSSALHFAAYLARELTARQVVVVFSGCRKNTLPPPVVELPLDDEEALTQHFFEKGEHTALVLIEPLPTGAGILRQRPEFLQKIRKLSLESGALLLFDESLTAFRGESNSLASSLYLDWDFLLLGESISCAFPFAALVSKKEHLPTVPNFFSWEDEVPSQVTLLAVLYSLRRLAQERENNLLIKLTAELEDQFIRKIAPIFAHRGLKLTVETWPGMFYFRFGLETQESEVRSPSQTWKSHFLWYAWMQRQMVKKGVYLSPISREPSFLSLAHQEKDIFFLIENLRKVSIKFLDRIKEKTP